MPDLNFIVEGATGVAHAAAPLLAFRLRVENQAAQEAVHTVIVRCQIQIEASRRRYTPDEQARLLEIFGEPDRWSQTLRSLLWTHTSVVVPGFAGATAVDLPVTCTFDFNVAATKYFHGLADGDLPLCFLFSGTTFYQDGDGRLQAAPISWDKEARFRLPVRLWRELMDMYYPGTTWLSLPRGTFERLYRYKLQRGLPTWEQTVEHALAAADDWVPS